MCAHERRTWWHVHLLEWRRLLTLWSLEGDALHFAPIGVDPCPGRAEVLDDKTYTRATR
jgi:hypothetical protein